MQICVVFLAWQIHVSCAADRIYIYPREGLFSINQDEQWHIVSKLGCFVEARHCNGRCLGDMLCAVRLHNEDTPEKRRLAAAAATAASARRSRPANGASDALARAAGRLQQGQSGGEPCLSSSTSFKRAADAGAPVCAQPPGSGQAGPATGALSGLEAASAGGSKPAKPAVLASAKGKGSDAARCGLHQ